MYLTLFSLLLSTAGGTFTDSPPPLSSPPPPLPAAAERLPSFSPFRPSIAVIVGVLTTMFSLTFLLLLYAKHCKRTDSSYGSGDGYGYGYGFPSTGVTELRRNSGVRRAVVESLPVIRFGALKGEKDGLECAVCLGRFEPTEPLRILPKCRHGFHVECVDTWLDAHSTCPLCRVRVEPEDILISVSEPEPNPKEPNPKEPNQIPVQTGRRVSGRHSTGSFQASANRSGLGANRRSADSTGCFDIGKIRKDRVLLNDPVELDREAFERRFSHRIVVGDGEGTVVERWSDLRPSDLVFLRSAEIARCGGGGREVINARSLSEIAGLSRLGSRPAGPSRIEEERKLRRWLDFAALRTAKLLRGPPSSDRPST